jgi:hypothetical protein
METKYCPKCKLTLNVESFYKNSAQPDKLAPYCKRCWAEHNHAQHAKRRVGMVDKRRVKMETIRHDYFHVMERPLQAYLLGLLASDGCVHSNRPRVQLSVIEPDRFLVDILQQELAPDYPISISQRKDRQYRMVKITFTSSEMCRDLALLGVHPRKSLVLTWPEMLPSHLINSYLLGILDGDGWVTLDRRKHNPYYTVGIMSASLGFIERAAQEITKALDIPLAHPNMVNNCVFTLRYGGKKATLIDEWLHRDLPGLERKRLSSKSIEVITH